MNPRIYVPEGMLDQCGKQGESLKVKHLVGCQAQGLVANQTITGKRYFYLFITLIIVIVLITLSGTSSYIVLVINTTSILLLGTAFMPPRSIGRRGPNQVLDS